MKTLFQLISLLLCFVAFVSCNSDDEAVVTSSLRVISITPDAGPLLVGEDVEIQIEVITDPSIGIQSMVVEKEGFELYSRSDYTANLLTFIYETKTILADLENGGANFVFKLTDKNGTVVTLDVPISVEVEYGYFMKELVPNPGWDLVSNSVNAGTSGDNLDLLIVNAPNVDGGQEVHIVSRNSTVFYNISQSGLDFLDPNFTQADVEAAISGITPVDSLLWKSGVMDASRFPLVAKLRGSTEYAVLGFSSVNSSVWGYKKRSEGAGN